MKYHEKRINLDNPLSFWTRFKDEERFLFYNPQNKEFIMGAKRLKTLSIKEDLKDYLYIFSSISFFDSIKDKKWQDFGNENVAFEYYFVEKDGKQTLYYYKDLIEIENKETRICKHNYKHLTNDYQEWQQLFLGVKNAISRNEVDKVVISREVKIECKTIVNIESVLQNLLEKNPNSFVFAYYKDGKTFLGATPELLVQKEKSDILACALAGTILRTDKEDEVEKSILMSDEKNRHEHQIVINSIVDVMKKYTSEMMVDETTIMTLKNLHHLSTNIYAKDNNSLLLEWVKRLHPTPALGGNPSKNALELIRKYEKHERGLYAAPIGLINGNGDGLFVVGIRSALIEDNIVYAYSGCGIVEQSDCELEYSETKNKLRTILESI